MPDQVGEQKTLYVVVCAAGPASEVGTLVGLAQEWGWSVQVIATPAAVDFIDVEALEKQTGRPVRSQHRAQGESRSSKADAIIIDPATLNTINKLANGIADNYALDVVNEAIGLGVPTAILPFANSTYASRAPFKKSVEKIHQEGIQVIIDPRRLEPHKPDKGEESRKNYPWILSPTQGVFS